MIPGGALLSILLAVGPEVSATPTRPALPYESLGACPFECCTYRTWTVNTDTDLLAERRDGAPVVFRVRRGQQVVGLTGVVVTAELGRAVVRRTTTIGETGTRLTVQPCDKIYVLHYVGEGYWKLWVRGRILDEQLADKGECQGDNREPVECAIQIIAQPKATWWAKVRSRKREGWTRQLDHFGEIDACS